MYWNGYLLQNDMQNSQIIRGYANNPLLARHNPQNDYTRASCAGSLTDDRHPSIHPSIHPYHKQLSLHNLALPLK